MLATIENMRRVYPEDRQVRNPDTGHVTTIITAKPFAYSPDTGEQCSANPADYFWMRPDDVLTDCDGEPMVLAFERTRIEIIEA